MKTCTFQIKTTLPVFTILRLPPQIGISWLNTTPPSAKALPQTF